MNQFELEEKTTKLGQDVIVLCKKIRETTITRPLISQIVRSSGSVGANYAEANNASSKKDFRNKLYIAKKEAQETKHWLKLLATADEKYLDEIRVLWQNAHEIVLILQKSLHTLDNKNVKSKNDK